MTTKQKVEKLYKKVRTFIITAVASDGYPLTKAMVPPKYRESLAELYFGTNTQSKFAAAVFFGAKGNVYFFSKGLPWKGCYLKGNFEIVSDMEVKKRFWQAKYKNAYPTEKNYTDPDFCLLRFVPKSGRFYSWYKVDDFNL